MFILVHQLTLVAQKIVIREIGTTTKHDYTNADMVTKTSKNIIDDLVEVFTLTDGETSQVQH